MPSACGEFLPAMSFRRVPLWLISAVMILVSITPLVKADDPDEAVKIFSSLKPSVVSIYNSEGSGTGVLLNADGLILTCAHVVTSPIPYEVKVDLGTADEPKVTVFKKVQIVGYHPERDLALIKIDPKENNATLSPATISKDKAATGQRIYAIGDPGAGDKVLEKTITQGIISGVDREFDQQKFYQIDSAINPGNSGGPVVDHNGKVLGIVSFIFLNKQALNFAIPLRDVDLTKFGPLTDHKANPSRSAELMAMAKEFRDLAQQAFRDQGGDSDTYKRFTVYAAYCYAEALIYDPANPEIYTDIGNEYIVMDLDESAAAYLVRALELRPWGVNNSMTYHSLGVAWNKQKMGDKAIVAWKEGLAKFPYSAALWDDCATYNLDKENYADAAYDASVALACGPRKSRISALQRILRDSRAKLDDSDKSDLAKKVDHDTLCDALDKMRVRSNKARKRKSLYMTVAFVDLMKQAGTLDVPGVEDKISQVPLRAPENLAIGEDVADNDADADKTDKPKSKKQITLNDAPDDGTDTPTPPHKKPPGIPDDGDDIAPPHRKMITTPDGDDGGDDQPTPPPHHKAVKPEDSDKPDSDKSDSDEAPKNKAKPADPKTGGDDWLGGAKKGAAGSSDKPDTTQPVKPSTIIAPTPAITGLDLAGAESTVDDARVIPLDIDNQEISDAVLSSDGAFAYVLQKTGMLRKVAIPSMKEERQTDLATTAIGMGMTRKGLVMYVNSAQEIWLLDPHTLEVKHRTPLPGVFRMVSSPAINRVLVSTGPDDLQLVDPVAQTVIATFSASKLADSAPGLNFGLFALSPDGQNLFCQANGSLCEFALSESDLTFVSASPKLGTEPQNIIVSSDSRYVAMPCKGGNIPPGGEAKKDFATYIFRFSDLQKPIMTINTAGDLHEMAFDAPARQIYTQSPQRQLIVFAPGGDKIKDYVLGSNKGAITQKFAVHPNGHSLLVLAGGSVQWVTLP